MEYTQHNKNITKFFKRFILSFFVFFLIITHYTFLFYNFVSCLSWTTSRHLFLIPCFHHHHHYHGIIVSYRWIIFLFCERVCFAFPLNLVNSSAQSWNNKNDSHIHKKCCFLFYFMLNFIFYILFFHILMFMS